MSPRIFRSVLLAVVLAFIPPLLHAEAVIKPVPDPDLSRLPAETADQLRSARKDFEKYRVTLVGAPLAEAYALMGAMYASNGFFDAAAVAMEDAALLEPKDARWVYSQGIIARAQNQAVIAQNYFDLAFGLDKEYLPIRIAVAHTKLDNNDLEGARRLLADYVAKHTDQAAPYAMLGDIALRQKRYAEAIEQTRKALALDPKATRLYATLADAQAGAGDAKGAAESRAKAGAVEPTLDDPLVTGMLGAAAKPMAAPTDALATAMDGVVIALGLHQYDAARVNLDRVMRDHPNDAALLALYARVEAAAGNLSAATTRAAAAVAADANNALAHLSQGVAAEMSGDDKAAQRAYEEAIRLDAKQPEPRMLLGALLMRTGRADAAVVPLRGLVQLDFDNAGAWTHLIAADVAAGRCADALRDVSDVLGHDAENNFLLQMFVRLASTCAAASAEQRRGALEIGAKLYRGNAAAPVGEAYALALAANGKWDDAVKTQEAAIFILVRNGLKQFVPGYREFLQQFRARTLPDRPWPANSSLFHPARLAPDPKPAAASPAPKK